MRQAGEPRVEDILESIKRVIAREDRTLARGEAQPEPDQEAVVPDGGSDDADVLDLGESDLALSAAALEESKVQGEDLGQTNDSAPLPVAESTRESMRGSFETLALAAEDAELDSGRQSEQIHAGEAALEALLREMLRPQLAEWLDRRLPAIVEQLVAAEIARITGKRG